ncbi:MAG: hypothetical protein KH355_14745 [Clostridiales bacterium]|nr:hypothetical protein [Clostridiales bacterium]
MQMEQRLEMIERMRNQEMTEQSRLYQALHSSGYSNRPTFMHETEYSPYYMEDSYHRERKIDGGHEGISFKIRILLAISLGIFLFSLKGSEQEVIVQKAMKHLSDYPTIEAVADELYEEVFHEVGKVVQ